ncbi:hypothetical protein DI041_03835 [Stenotrophomonas maltophilia]|uniref:hypothetical protein n=1 Tax=Stenotrophomonas maltophilia TaxID=40324 RepID=UPI0010AA18F7|nr:hypothetical protein [Stenotrophomonas maltophilia]TIE21032.1 hypothetical protein DI034_02295 [Stenotrophomonas maltophilia]TIE64457.1 hypothetical protein DI041_03835 [Stenotrophomonas maltophilia]
MAKPTIRTSTSALVQVTVEVRAGSWGEGCQLDQVYRQAAASALGKLSRVLEKEGVRIVGVASIKAITTDTAVRNG